MLHGHRGKTLWWSLGKKEGTQPLDHCTDLWSKVIEQVEGMLGMHRLLNSGTPRPHIPSE